jgi:tetratricopeptide (TPR) repeat protein
LLARIESELQDCVDPVRRTDLMAERACYLARSGDADEANRIATELRSYSGRSSNPRAMLWVMIIEALVLFFDKLSASAEDRMNRACALSSSLGLEDLCNLSSAWLAHFKFDRSEYAGMSLHLRRVLDRDTHASAASVLRAAIVAADAFRFAGKDREAQGWYEIARSIATNSGDRTAIGAIMYNRAAFGLAYLSAESESTGKDVDPDCLQLILLEIESAKSFQDGTRVTALTHLTRHCHAQALMLAGRWAEAAAGFEAVLEVLETIDDRPKRPDVRADLAWCWLHIGRQSEAVSLLSEISMQSAEAMDIDDQVTYLSRLIQLRQRLGMESPTPEEHTHFRAVCDAYLKHIELLRAELEPLSPARCNLQPFNS